MAAIGEGVFETVRIVDSQPRLVDRHLARLARSSAAIGLAAPDLDLIRREVAAHLDSHRMALGRMRLTWLATPEGPALALDSAPTAPPAAAISLAIGDWAVDPGAPLVGSKTTAYADYAIALQHAVSQGFDDALLTTISGLICETSTANLFYVVDGILHTPTLATGCLPGIARAVVLEMCDVTEVDAALADLATASEVFVTSSLRGVQPVSRIGEWTYRTGGPETSKALAAWERCDSR
ncbi:MAG: aminotransferase class IV [Marmoricola sp.]